MLNSKTQGTLIEAEIKGRRINFFVANPNDVIQSEHLRGEFYEMEEMSLMAAHMNAGTRYLDIGSNVGNHVLYFSKFLGLRGIVPIEPNPVAAHLMQINLQINGVLDSVDLAYLGFGLADSPGKAQLLVPRDNLGGARCLPDPKGEIRVTTGDKLLGERDFDFVKIDVETMELQCLQGLSRLIRRCRPTLFVEVDIGNMARFKDWCARSRYMVKDQYRRYRDNVNFLIVPA